MSTYTSIIAALGQRWDTYRRTRQTVFELSALSPSNLADLGIAPGNIDLVAREAAKR